MVEWWCYGDSIRIVKQQEKQARKSMFLVFFLSTIYTMIMKTKKNIVFCIDEFDFNLIVIENFTIWMNTIYYLFAKSKTTTISLFLVQDV